VRSFASSFSRLAAVGVESGKRPDEVLVQPAGGRCGRALGHARLQGLRWRTAEHVQGRESPKPLPDSPTSRYVRDGISKDPDGVSANPLAPAIRVGYATRRRFELGLPVMPGRLDRVELGQLPVDERLPQLGMVSRRHTERPEVPRESIDSVPAWPAV